MKKLKLSLLFLLCSIILGCSGSYIINSKDVQKNNSTKSKTVQDQIFPIIQLPAEFRAQRQNTNLKLVKGQSEEIFRAEGAGCIRHIFFVIGGKSQWEANPIIKIYTDKDPEPQVNMDLHHFFGVLLGQKPYRLDCAAFQHLPQTTGPVQGPGYNCYLPIPFGKSCRITIEATDDDVFGATMVDWQQYPEGTDMTPYRLHAIYQGDMPAKHRGSILMADISGRGFIAGIFKGIRQRDFSDMIYHTGGQLWLIDGETDPHAIKGFNEEDDFSFFWGYQPIMTKWIGCPYHRIASRENQDGVIYRIFGPDPVPFSSSLVLRCGSRADDTESVGYYYRELGSEAPKVHTPESWQITGPIPCPDYTRFLETEPFEEYEGTWPEQIRVGDGRDVPVHTVKPEHTWIDMWPYYHQGGSPDYQHSGSPEALINHSVYARTSIESDRDSNVEICLGFGDWFSVWLNDEKLGSFRHDDGFKTLCLEAKLRSGANELLIKTNNTNSGRGQHRLWAWNCVIKDSK